MYGSRELTGGEGSREFSRGEERNGRRAGLGTEAYSAWTEAPTEFTIGEGKEVKWQEIAAGTEDERRGHKQRGIDRAGAEDRRFSGNEVWLSSLAWVLSAPRQALLLTMA